MPPKPCTKSPPSSLLCIPQHEQEQGRDGTGGKNRRKGLSHLLDILVGCMGTSLVTPMVGYRAKSWEGALWRAQDHVLGEGNISFCLTALAKCYKRSSQACVWAHSSVSGGDRDTAAYCPVSPAGEHGLGVLDALVWHGCTSTHSPTFSAPHQHWPGRDHDPGVLRGSTHIWPGPLG